MPEASNSMVATLGTVDPGVKERMVAPPSKVPASASNVVKRCIRAGGQYVTCA